MAKWEDFVLRDDRASQPAANTVPIGTLYYVTDESVLERSDGASWESYSNVGAGISQLTGDVTAGPGSGSQAATIANLAVTTAKLNDLAVTTGKLAAGAVTEAKQTLADNTTGNVTSAAHGYAPKSPGAAGRYLNGLATPAYGFIGMELIETQTPSGVTFVTFSSLGSYNHLRVMINARGDQAAATSNLIIFFNGDTAANYDRQIISGNAATALVAENFAHNTLGMILVPAASATAGFSGIGDVIIPDYAGTTFQKLALATHFYRTGTASGNMTVRVTGNAWRNTAAITSITFQLLSGNFVAGSKFSLYGMY